MADNDNDGPFATASDIITYIGVPLAVLGVLPILYNTFFTLAALSRIKRMLRHSRLTALTRSDIVNRVIEVELPRYAVTPWDRFEQRHDYWSLSTHPSAIPGGTWTTFNWKTNAIGIKTQRVEYADQLRQPQVEVAFDELVCYLLDLGAVPDAHGWRLLRSTGLWTPVGCALMMSPDGQHKALTVAPLDDSDGHLSLAVNWSSHWTERNHVSLPPYWVYLPAPPPPEKDDEGGAEEEAAGEGSTLVETKGEGEAEIAADPKPEMESKDKGKDKVTATARPGSSSTAHYTIDSIEHDVQTNATKAITCQISVDGIINALPQDEGRPASSKPDGLYIDHLRTRRDKMDGTWFASAMTAYGTTSQTILWNYRIPDDVLAFCRKETVPCGVLELLGVVDDSMTPEWATKHDDLGFNVDQHARRTREQREAMMAEARMAPAQRDQAVRDRMRRENQQRMDDMRDKMRLDAQRREARQMEAMQSPKWDTKLVAEHNLRWLRGRKHVPAALSMKDVVGAILHQMVLDGQFAGSICRMLDLWKAWADNGGMRRSDYISIQEDQLTFAKASLLIAVVKDTSMALEGTLSMDLQECLRMWRSVRLG